MKTAQPELFSSGSVRVKTKAGEIYTRDLYVRHSEPSKEAAVAIREPKGKLLMQVFDVIAASDGLTDQEIERETGLGGSTVRPRRRELECAGLVRDSGKRRKTESGRQAVVWEKA